MCDMGHERDFMENLLNQRFNFLLVFFSLVVAGALSADNKQHFTLVLAVGSVICFLVSLTVYRCQKKLDIAIHHLPKEHAAHILDKEAGRMFGVRKVVGYVIPSLCWILLVIGALLAHYDVLQYGKT